MLIVAGSLSVDPEARDAYLAGCSAVVASARRSEGCLDFALSADLVDPGRINVFERWESEADLRRFRGSGPSDSQQAELREVDVREYVVAEPAG